MAALHAFPGCDCAGTLRSLGIEVPPQCMVPNNIACCLVSDLDFLKVELRKLRTEESYAERKKTVA